MKTGLVFLLLIITGCASSKTVPLPDGSTGYFVRCKTEDYCLIEASKLCGSYDVVSTRDTLEDSLWRYQWMIRCTGLAENTLQ